jgi:predicted Fe-Mo cluster-binding NifX family protein
MPYLIVKVPTMCCRLLSHKTGAKTAYDVLSVPSYAVPLANPDGILSEHFGEAPYFALVRVRLADRAVEEQQTLANPYQHEEKAKGIRAAEWLVEHKVDVVRLKQSLEGKGPVYVFGDAGVEMQETEATTLAEVLKEASQV